MFREIIFAGCVKYPIFNLPLQYCITKNRSRLLRTEPPAYLLRPGVHLFQRHLRRTITKSVYIAIISRLVGYFLNNYAFHILVGSLMNTHIRPALGTIINHSIINAVNLNTIFVLGRNVAIRANSTAQYFPLFLCQSYIHNRQSRGYSPGCKYAIAFNSFWRSVAQLTLRAIHSSAGFSAIHSFR